jgi:hypothetical protein
MRRPIDRATGEARRLPPTSWLIARAATRVLAALPPAGRELLLRDPMAPRAWHLFRDMLHELDRRHGSRAGWLHAPMTDDDTTTPTPTRPE